MKEKLHTHEYDIKNIIKQQHNIIYLKPLQPKYIPKYTYISSYNTMSSLSSYEQKMMRERMIKKIKNETMGDVMFQHLKDSFGDDLKVKNPDEDISQSSQKKNKKKKKGGKQSDITSIDPSNLKNLKENKNNNIKMIQPSTGNNNNNNNNNNANKPVATYTTKDGKKGTLTAAEYIKLQKAYQKYKIENTPRSFNKNATPGTDYNKWDKFVKELDKEEEEEEKMKNQKKEMEKQKQEKEEQNLLRQANIDKSKEIGTNLKVLTVVISFVITFGISFMMDIRSTFIKQVIFAIVAIIIFFALLYDQQNESGWYAVKKKKKKT